VMFRPLHGARMGAVLLSLAALNACSPKTGGPPPASLTVELVKPETLTWPQQIRASGGLLAWQEAIISAQTGPLRIDNLRADVGARVRRGQVLANLSPDTLLADRARLRAAVAEAEANLAQADSDVDRASQVASSGALSAQQIQKYAVTQRTAQAALAQQRAQLRSTEIQLAQTQVTAVDDGVVSSRSALLGKVVNSGEELFRLVRQGRVEWQAELDAQQLSRVRAGQRAEVRLPGGEAVTGAVRLVSPTLNTSTSRGVAYVSLPPGSPARAGMYGSGVIDVGASQVMTLPDTAVVLRDGRAYVFVVGADKRAHRRAVTTGARQGGRIEVSGLGGEVSVVKSGAAFLSDGASVLVTGAVR